MCSECDKLCDIGQYLDYKNCVCRKSLVDKLVEECINVIDGDTMYNETLSINPNDFLSRTPYVVLFIHWYKNRRQDLKDFSDAKCSKIETKIY